MRQVRPVFDGEGATGLGPIRAATAPQPLREATAPQPLREATAPEPLRDTTGPEPLRGRPAPGPLRAASGPGPLRDVVALDGDGSCISQARHRAADFLARARDEYGLPVSARAMDVTRLVVSELVTNARKYAPGPVRMELRVVGALVEVAVCDGEPVLPVARTADARRVGQHGLEIVMAVAQDFHVRRDRTGKRVTVRIALTDAPGAPAGGRRTP
ncbi:ATP-binding protein [Streptomyces similanensis]|uniref:Histidine kinase/HSP90-like ATPase domain-containing protein n=1 Tax=Streptomyces similanensis TaxID=1274988 RepID=A0ABP9LEJ3_9ACTN